MATRESNTEKNTAKVKKVLSLIEKGYNVEDACNKVKISKPTFYHWKRYVVSLEEEKLNFVELYAKRLKNELENHLGLILKISDCILVVEKMFNKTGTENQYDYAEKPSYIELTAHSFKNSKTT
jgi:ACT domain-containing protein